MEQAKAPSGAGKSTIVNILYGFLSKDSGHIIIRGEEVEPKSPQDAIDRGVGMVHQHFKLIPPLTVIENVILGLEPASKKPDQNNSLALISASLLVLILMYFLLPPVEFLFSAVVLLVFLTVLIRPLQGIGNSATLARFGGVLGRLGSDVLPLGFDDAANKIRRIADENGLTVDPYAKVQDLSVGLQQRVEVIKTLYREADILILDEPTSVLTPQEVDELFVTLETFRKSGKTIILITHKLREPMALCDRISVLRDGALVGTVNKDETSAEELAQMMVGRPVVFTVEKPPATPGNIILNVNDLKVEDYRGLPKVRGVSFQVRAGEILGIAGVEGNGQTELVEALVGLRESSDGAIFVGDVNTADKNLKRGSTIFDYVLGFFVCILGIGINVLTNDLAFGILAEYFGSFVEHNFVYRVLGPFAMAFGLALVLGYEALRPNNPRFVREAEVSHIPEDRHRRGLILPFTVEENLILGRHYRPPFISMPGILALDTFGSISSGLVEDYSIKTTGVDSFASTLSGGNQQKLVVARELESSPKLLIAAQPTRGLDVGATEFIHKTLISMRDQGVAILLVSAELDEIRSVADRILVMFDGRIVGEKMPDETDAQELGLLMAGHLDGEEQTEAIN
jgi:simple sugar transport system ATP-binding protein